MSLTVGEKIKKYRIERGLTQEELGKILGVGKAAVQKYESNQVQNLKSAHIKKLCTLFNKIPYDFIYDGIYTEQVHTLEQLQTLRRLFGNEANELLLPLSKLNEKGLNNVHRYILDMTKIEEYCKPKNYKG